MWQSYLVVTDGRTDGQTTIRGVTAVCVLAYSTAR